MSHHIENGCFEQSFWDLSSRNVVLLASFGASCYWMTQHCMVPLCQFLTTLGQMSNFVGHQWPNCTAINQQRNSRCENCLCLHVFYVPSPSVICWDCPWICHFDIQPPGAWTTAFFSFLSRGQAWCHQTLSMWDSREAIFCDSLGIEDLACEVLMVCTRSFCSLSMHHRIAFFSSVSIHRAIAAFHWAITRFLTFCSEMRAIGPHHIHFAPNHCTEGYRQDSPHALKLFGTWFGDQLILTCTADSGHVQNCI